MDRPPTLLDRQGQPGLGVGQERPQRTRARGGCRPPGPPATCSTWKDETITRSVQPASAMASAVSAATVSPGSCPGWAGSFLISTLTTMPSQTASASASRGTWAGKVGDGQARPPGPARRWSGSWWMARAPSASEPDVELDAVGPQTLGFGERFERVLDEPVRTPPMGENRRHRRPFSQYDTHFYPSCSEISPNCLPAPRQAITLFSSIPSQ